ncbi:hypothetical protein [Massilia sp. YIM B04103]|uniref:hypothetical protein n=1 Tax=Massilia sp. YIM B04103 TaxID=2963106 RepID=UPI00210A8E55|nr:hypothetical protein [Massilia sp. YIM B04103]
MSTKTTVAAPTPFSNVFVIAIPFVEDGKTYYKTTFVPEKLRVLQPDTVINYQLISPTPTGVKIDSVTVKPEHSSQLSDPAIGDSGKLAVIIDANTVAEKFNITLHFSDTDGVKFDVDPEVSNEPPA